MPRENPKAGSGRERDGTRAMKESRATSLRLRKMIGSCCWLESGLCFEIGGFGFGGNDEMAVTVADELGIRRYQAEAIVIFFCGGVGESVRFFYSWAILKLREKNLRINGFYFIPKKNVFFLSRRAYQAINQLHKPLWIIQNKIIPSRI